MYKLYISPSKNTPEIIFSPEENIYEINGNSSPEDVRALYYPVIEWFSEFATEIKAAQGKQLLNSPLVFKFDLRYFNSSSAKFIYDIIIEIKGIREAGIPVSVQWYFDREDYDMMDAGKDISSIAELDFEFFAKDGDERPA